MIYWRARNGGKYGSDGDFSALHNSGGAKLELASQLDFRREKQYAIVSLHSPTDQLTFSILPGEAKTVTLNFYIHQLNGEAEYLRVDSNLSSLYNKLRQTNLPAWCFVQGDLFLCFIIVTHQQSWWFCICGQSPMILATPKGVGTVCRLRKLITCYP